MTGVGAPCGVLRGVDDDGVLAFLGIPYAEPPVGPLRFRPPVPFSPWPGERDAIEFGPASIQVPNRGIFDEVGDIAESCLFLNVWTPAADKRSRPVFVWFHGGGLRAGSGSEALSHGARLARYGDCVVVTLNYRLGVLGGFVYLNEIGDPRLAESANVGLLDQLVALRWVHDNIEAFGGNPECVTVAGQSSGGQSAAMMLGLPAARGLLHRVIVQSGAPPVLASRDDMLLVADQFTALLREQGIEAAAIFDASTDVLVGVQGPLKRAFDWGRIGHPFNPLIDGVVIDRQPLEYVRDGRAAGIPVLAGSTRTELVMNFGRENAPAADEPELTELWADAFPGSETDGTPVVKRFARAYSAGSLSGLDPPASESVTALWSDKMCRMGAVRLLEAQAPRAESTYSYLFTWESPTGKGVPHCLDVPFVFGSAAQSKFGRFVGDGQDVASMTALVQDSWLAFMRTGNPGTDALPVWPRYETERRATMLLEIDARVVDDLWSEQRLVWDGIL